MKVYTNAPRLKRYQRIATITLFGGMAVLALSIILSFRPQYVNIAWLLAFVGLGIATIGSYYVNRWLRRPMPDEVLAQVLKRLDKRHVLYNYFEPVRHLLLTPSGLVVLHARRYEGKAECVDGQWRGKRGIWRIYTRGLTAENLGNPTAEARQAVEAVREWLRRRNPEIADAVDVDAVVVFINPDAVELRMTGECGDVPVVFPKQVRAVLNKQVLPKMRTLNGQTYMALKETLDQAFNVHMLENLGEEA
ncbi:hypothetical protein ARMA_0403 [Ardenticatena maritima]|uniref:NERD domain-containing protein n=1 Tax=Ardenticatena maritima TaxID=872965 RepID=A0A0M9UBP1_9CHLR|nr:NERD domain-containing protein [Ardenticatena maritima]KPL87766.1 hypothetical protein SE16_09305 [Ardenticatena maritima]GAP61980.1 hypothetical protein ARMA_0403 [Ardenticatena maritima]